MAGSPERLVPHIKTHKTREIVLLQMEQGIRKFKCATIAEAEMLASTGAKWILIAYQLVGPNIDRLIQLKEKFPDVYFASLLDDLATAQTLSDFCNQKKLEGSVFLDVNVGMNRSGATAAFLTEIIDSIKTLPNIQIDGLHIYDGHIHTVDFDQRKKEVDRGFNQAQKLIEVFIEKIGKEPVIIAGGSPSFNVHTFRPGVLLSPGTNVLWDAGYGEKFKDQDFLGAAIILSRIISKPSVGLITLDLGHKAIAAENPIERRIKILNLDNYQLLSQSEEHGVIQVPDDIWHLAQVGDVYYIQPYHICPTVALHEYAHIVKNGWAQEEWQIIARKRRINI